MEYYLETMLRKPGALANSVALKQAPELYQLFINNYSENPREFPEILMDNKDVMDSALLASEHYRTAQSGKESGRQTN